MNVDTALKVPHLVLLGHICVLLFCEMNGQLVMISWSNAFDKSVILTEQNFIMHNLYATPIMGLCITYINFGLQAAHLMVNLKSCLVIDR